MTIELDITEFYNKIYPHAWLEYYQQCEQGIASGNLFADDDGQVYYVIGG